MELAWLAPGKRLDCPRSMHVQRASNVFRTLFPTAAGAGAGGRAPDS